MPLYINPNRAATTLDLGSPTRRMVKVLPLGAPAREGDVGAIEMTEAKANDFVRMGLLRMVTPSDVHHGKVFDHTAAAKAAEEAVNVRMARLRRG